MKTLILHHSADLDGVLSGVIANYYITQRMNAGDVIIHAGADYGDRLDRDYDGINIRDFDKIYVLDFSDDWLFNELPDKIIWIDHHKTAIAKVYKVNQYTEDGVAACRLVLQFFTNINYVFARIDSYKSRSLNEFLFVTLAGEYDIWDQQSKFARMLNFGMLNLDFDYIDFIFRDTKRIHTSKVSDDETLIKNNDMLSNIITAGDGVINYIQRTSGMLGGGDDVTLFGHNGKSFNTHIKSSLIHTPKQGEEFTFVWNFKDGKIKASFYSESIDISKFALHFGGGGHRGAAGCTLAPHVLTEILNGGYSNVRLG